MSAQEYLENMIKELNFKSNLYIPDIEEDGSFCYNFANKFDFMIKASDQDDQIAFYAFLLKGLKRPHGLFKKMLRHNFLLSDTYGAAFALAKRSGDISLRRFFSTQDMDAIEFENQINNFLFTADEWHTKLNDWLQHDDNSHAKKQDTGPPASIAQFLKA